MWLVGIKILKGYFLKRTIGLHHSPREGRWWFGSTFGDRCSQDGIRSSFRELALWVAEVGRFSGLGGYHRNKNYELQQNV